jgi:hypothetical protein
MSQFRSGAGLGAAVLLALAGDAPASRAAAQAPAPQAPVYKSVYGTLESVDKSQRGVIMKSETGERLAWRFEAAVVAEAARFKPGDRMIVIYRQLRPNEKAVTALAFPGSASTPIYLNMTGSRVVLRSGPAVGGTCGQADAGPAKEASIPSGGLTEISDACWCCAPEGETCTPANESGLGRALLVQCYK